MVLRLIWAALTVIVGVYLIVEPHNGTLTLTLVLGIYFLFMGLTRVAVAFVGRGQQGAGLVGLSGVCGLLIGILVLAKFPSSADWAIGLLVGIDLIFAGWTLTSVALVGKDLSALRTRLKRRISASSVARVQSTPRSLSLTCLLQTRRGFVWNRADAVAERSRGGERQNGARRPPRRPLHVTGPARQPVNDPPTICRVSSPLVLVMAAGEGTRMRSSTAEDAASRLRAADGRLADPRRPRGRRRAGRGDRLAGARHLRRASPRASRPWSSPSPTAPAARSAPRWR